MMQAIKPIQSNEIYRVNPVQLYERQKGNPFDRSLFDTNQNFNLNHPKAGNDGIKANHLDFLA